VGPHDHHPARLYIFAVAVAKLLSLLTGVPLSSSSVLCSLEALRAYQLGLSLVCVVFYYTRTGVSSVMSVLPFCLPIADTTGNTNP